MAMGYTSAQDRGWIMQEWAIIAAPLAAIAGAIATVILAALTYQYVRATNGILEETREARHSESRPYVTAYLSVEHHEIYLTVRNVGRTAAVNVSFHCPPSISNIYADVPEQGLLEPGVLSNGIAFFPPQQKYRTAMENYTRFYQKATDNSWNKHWDIAVTCQDHQTHEKHSEQIRLDLTQFYNRGSIHAGVPQKAGMYHLVKGIQRLEDAILELRDT